MDAPLNQVAPLELLGVAIVAIGRHEMASSHFPEVGLLGPLLQVDCRPELFSFFYC
jgi:hypothetical protein